jgi:hypothetical protein
MKRAKKISLADLPHVGRGTPYWMNVIPRKTADFINNSLLQELDKSGWLKTLGR